MRKNLILIKCLIVLTGLFLLLFLAFPIVAVYAGYEVEEVENIWLLLFILGVISCAALIIVRATIKLSNQKKKSERLQLVSGVRSFEQIYPDLDKSLLRIGYTMLAEKRIQIDCVMYLYIKPTQHGTVQVFCIIRLPELTDDILNSANDTITEVLCDYYQTRLIRDYVNMISVFCVDRVTSAFQKLLNGGVEQGFKNGRFNAGISFGKGGVYIAENTGRFPAKYHTLKNDFECILRKYYAEEKNDKRVD